MFDIITVPVDGSEYGFMAADVAIEIAQKFNSKIVAVHVLEEFSFNSYDDEGDYGDAILEKITNKASKFGVEVTQHLLTADPLRDMKFIIENKYIPNLNDFLSSFFINIHNKAQHIQLSILYTVTYPFDITNDGASIAVKSLTAWLIQLYPG